MDKKICEKARHKGLNDPIRADVLGSCAVKGIWLKTLEERVKS